MSKNITIQEGGTAKQLTADKLETNLVGGGTCLWIPEDETMLGTKVITEDGTYKASDEGLYGYSEVTVRGIGTATGTGPDGETHSYTETGGGGISDTILPDSISVTTLPTVTTYADGAVIDYSGMAVKAYLKSGEVWSDTAHPDGVIPTGELMLPVITADASQVTDQTASGDLVTEPASPIKIGSTAIIEMHGRGGGGVYTQTSTFTGGTFVVVQGTDNPSDIQLICASPNPGTVTDHTIVRFDETGEIDKDTTRTYEFNRSYTYGGKTVYYYAAHISGIADTRVLSPSPEHLNTSRDVTENTVAWTIIYGDITGGAQSIPVQWTRPGDYSTLESSFDITVI